MTAPLETLTVESSVKWKSATVYEPQLTFSTSRGFAFALSLRGPGQWRAWLLSKCCRQELIVPFQSTGKRPFCGKCYEPASYAREELKTPSAGFALGSMGDWLTGPLCRTYDPLTAWALAMDLRWRLVEVYAEWGRKRDAIQVGDPAYRELITRAQADLAREFSGPLPPRTS